MENAGIPGACRECCKVLKAEIGSGLIGKICASSRQAVMVYGKIGPPARTPKSFAVLIP